VRKILQKDIAKVVKARKLIKEAEEEIEKTRVSLEEAQTYVFELLLEGAKVEDGKYTAGLENYKPATRPPWKDLYFEHMRTQHEPFNSLIHEAEVKTKYEQPERQRLVVGETGRKLAS